MFGAMLFTLALLLATPDDRQRGSVTPPLSPAAEAVVAAWRLKADACRAALPNMPKNATVAASLTVRVEAEQCLRRLLSDAPLAALPDADRASAMSLAWKEISPVDDANTAWLKTRLPADGWFRASRDGAQAAHDAWLIVQHSPDRVFQAQVLARMEPLAKIGEVNGSDYALLYDRVEMFAGRPQYYGSQYRCENGHWTPSPIRDPATVEARRKAMGLSTTAENLARMTENGGC